MSVLSAKNTLNSKNEEAEIYQQIPDLR